MIRNFFRMIRNFFRSIWDKDLEFWFMVVTVILLIAMVVDSVMGGNQKLYPGWW
jgi:hypothetical protein